MDPEGRAADVRRRLAAYTERQLARAATFDRLGAMLGAEPPIGGTEPPARSESATSAHPAAARIWSAPAVGIILPVHDAPEELGRCLWALARNTTHPAELIVIDDASSDPRIEPLLEWASGLTGVRILRNVQNLGFPSTVNRGLRCAAGDVVLLNSDTEVGPRWLEQLVLAAYADPATGTVTPLSDNAGAFSAPHGDRPNPLPATLSYDDAARVVSHATPGRRPAAPTGNGFCLYIKRAVIDAVGELDAAGFTRGYGEENDFCLRASALGWRNVVDERTYVHHEREASFGVEKAELVAAGRARIHERYPHYGAEVARWSRSEGIEQARQAVANGLAQAALHGPPRPRLLFVVHEGGGGAVATNRDLMGALLDQYDCFAFTSDRRALKLWQVQGSERTLVDQWLLEERLRLIDFSRADYRAAFDAALDRCHPELVHVRHLFKHTFDPPRLAAARHLPVVMSFHDHYFLCPTIHLLDERGRFCGGICTPTVGNCPTVSAGSTPPLKHAFVHQWREEATAALSVVDAFVTTSAHTRDIHRRFLPVTRERPFPIIEHGRDLEQRHGLATPPAAGSPIRIVVPGHLERHKGADLLVAIRELDHRGRLEFHFLGEVPEPYRQLGVVHGAYEREDLARIVERIRPAFVAVLSVTAESYSHAITEAWAAGVPVLVTDLGAQAARVLERGGGFIVPHADPRGALERILAAAEDPVVYAAQAARACVSGLPSVARMASRYSELYRDVIHRRRPFVAAEAQNPLSRGLWSVDLLASGGAGRLWRQLSHPSLRWKLNVGRGSFGQEQPAGSVVLVQASVVEPQQGRELAEEIRHRGLTLVLWCDRLPQASEEALLPAARIVIVEDSALVAAYSRRHPEIAVIPPALDERLFHPPAALRVRSPRRAARLVCVAPALGPAARRLLADVLERLRRDHGVRHELELVSPVAPADLPEAWRHIAAADPERDYESYAAVMAASRERWSAALVLPSDAPGEVALRGLEYAALRLPCVTAGDELASTREHGGVAEVDPERWCMEIDRLLADPDLAQRETDRAWAQLAAHGLIRHRAPHILRTLGRAWIADPRASERERAGAGVGAPAAMPGDGT